jgi:predicted aspartyl protease
MLQAGAHPGALLFRGQSNNHHYSGTAFVFSSRCGQLPYQVSGPILDDHEHVRLTGQKPEVGPDCSITGYFDDTLEFHLIKTLKESLPATPPAPDIGNPVTGQSISVPLKKEGGTYVVPVLINNAITLNFVVDSGASDVSIPADVVMTLFRTGTLEKPDFIGTQTYRLADGSTVPSATFRIRSLTVANTALENVTGSVAPVEGALLLGQSFLGRFKSWSIDNARQALVLEPQDGKTIMQPKQTEQGAKRPFRVVDASDGFLNIRNGPGPTYEAIAKMPLGATGLVGRCTPLDGGWKPFCEVEWQGVSGWASSCCMADLEEAENFYGATMDDLINAPDRYGHPRSIEEYRRMVPVEADKYGMCRSAAHLDQCVWQLNGHPYPPPAGFLNRRTDKLN